MLTHFFKVRPVATIVAFVVMFTPAIGRCQLSFTEYAGPVAPAFEGGYSLVDIKSGPDGNLWFTENYAFGTQTQIGKITPAGVTTYYSIPSGDSEGGITLGPDGNMWFTEYRTNKIGRITSAGVFTEYTIPTGGSFPGDITTGPDGNLWFIEALAGKIGRITTSGDITEFPIPGGKGAARIAAGPDGNVWFTEHFANKIGRITPDGSITEFAIPTSGSYPIGIVTGPDGNLWFTEDSGHQIGRITPAGDITEFPIATPGVNPLYITVGPDGNIWFTEDAGNQIGRVTTAGVITEFGTPTPSRLGGITTGPDGNLWFLEATANKIVRAVITPIDTTPPILTGVPPNISTNATSSSGAVVTYTLPTATDAVDGPVAVMSDHPSGSLFPVGPTLVTFTASDSHGNTATAYMNVVVTFAGTFFLQPINTDGSSIFKLGSTVPVKFQLTGASGGITNAVARLTYAKVSNGIVGTEVEAVSTAAATSGNLFQFDATGDLYIFNLSTKGLTIGSYLLRIDLNDGADHAVIISLK